MGDDEIEERVWKPGDALEEIEGLSEEVKTERRKEIEAMFAETD